MAFVSCTMSSARSAPFTWFHEEHCKLQRRCPTTAFSKSAALPRQGVPKAFPASFATGPCVVTILWHQASG
jgi:hypothetical protein